MKTSVTLEVAQGSLNKQEMNLRVAS